MKTMVNTHIGSYGIIIQNNKIALIRKARGGYKGKLDLPGGGIEHIETPVEALKREIMEEAGISVNSWKLIDCTSVNIKWNVENDLWEDLHHIGILYVVETNDFNLKEETDGLDSEGASWYEIDKLNGDELSPFAKYGLEKMGYVVKE